MKFRLAALSGLAALSFVAFATRPAAAVTLCSASYCSVNPRAACTCPPNSACPGCAAACNRQFLCNRT